MILGRVGLFDGSIARYVSAGGTPILAVYYRLAPEHPHPTPVEDAYVAWSWDDNRPGRGALLGDAVAGPDVPAHAAPARVAGPAGLPAAYIELGRLDIFRDEDLTYARRPSRAGVPVEFPLHPGVPHEFEGIAFTTDVARRVMADRIRVLSSL
ncbi:alpha/beta hydrolase [Streptomyces shenzhenensis]|uniref:alpha/beta hydrolase n=1 Tax=Streptomyces shenzhenensis TaxID=943815 RepID=UPI003D8D5A24